METPESQDPPRVNSKKPFQIREGKMLATAMSIGLSMVFAIFLGLGLGYLVDKHFATKPWGILIGLLIGLIAAFNNLIVLSRRLEKERQHFYGRDNKPPGE
ncbi:MAG: AtpZ/AtpI family protein [Deltaproteobacteria bacterium]|jgi:ATP synthase protein I|nr:AtpZ/AtpI family protein [Deltaproteobacteria bacterium]